MVENYNSDGEDMAEEQQQTCYDHEKTQSDFKSVIACWILKIKECCKLTQSTMEELTRSVTDLNQYILAQVFLAVKKVLAEAGQNIAQLNSIFDPNGSFGRPFEGIETSYQLLKYCKKNLGFVVSKHKQNL